MHWREYGRRQHMSRACFSAPNKTVRTFCAVSPFFQVPPTFCIPVVPSESAASSYPWMQTSLFSPFSAAARIQIPLPLPHCLQKSASQQKLPITQGRLMQHTFFSQMQPTKKPLCARIPGQLPGLKRIQIAPGAYSLGIFRHGRNFIGAPDANTEIPGNSAAKQSLVCRIIK